VRFYIGKILETATTDAMESQIWRAMRELADEMNSALDFEVTLEHLDCDDFLSFNERELEPEPEE